MSEIELMDVSEWGTFKDSLKAPVFGWFTNMVDFSMLWLLL